MNKVILLVLFFLSLPNISLAEELPVLINQVMIGQNENVRNEFVELYNPNDFVVSLADYSLKKKTASGNESNLISSRSFRGIIFPQSYFLIASPEFGSKINSDLNYSTSMSLADNNTVLLYNAKNEISDKLGYGEASDYLVQAAKNPENNTSLKRINIDFNEANNHHDFRIQEDLIIARNSRGDIIEIKNFREKLTVSAQSENKVVSLRDIRSFQADDYIITEGKVSVLPEVLGLQFFYIHQEYENDPNIYGLEIYSHGRNFPDLKIGDKVRVRGKLSILESESYPRYRLRTQSEDDIEIISSNQEIARPEKASISSLKDEARGSLKTVSGEIVQNNSQGIYLYDGQEDISINIKKGSNISPAQLKEESSFTISGILSYSSKGLEIIPLEEGDIINLNPEERKESSIKEIEDPILELETKNKKNEILKYLIASILIALLFLFFHKKIIKR
jgi:predicted extracellular nuclease